MELESMSPQDKLDVFDLIASYAHTLDHAEKDAFLDNFAPDAVVEFNTQRHAGHAGLGEWFDNLLSRGRIGDGAGARHFIGLPVVRGNAQRCTAHTYIALFRIAPAGQVAAQFVGSYTDTCVKVNGRWCFETRLIKHDIEGSADSAR
jgi:hypothetical protein